MRKKAYLIYPEWFKQLVEKWIGEFRGEAATSLIMFIKEYNEKIGRKYDNN